MRITFPFIEPRAFKKCSAPLFVELAARSYFESKFIEYPGPRPPPQKALIPAGVASLSR